MKLSHKELMTLKHIYVSVIDTVSIAVVVTPPAHSGNNVRACKQ